MFLLLLCGNSVDTEIPISRFIIEQLFYVQSMVSGTSEFLLPPGEKARMRDEAVRVAARLAHGEEVSLRYVEDARHRFLRSEIEHRRVRVTRVTGKAMGHVV